MVQMLGAPRSLSVAGDGSAATTSRRIGLSRCFHKTGLGWGPIPVLTQGP